MDGVDAVLLADGDEGVDAHEGRGGVEFDGVSGAHGVRVIAGDIDGVGFEVEFSC